MIKINPSNPKPLQFKMEITGNVNKPVARLLFPINNGSNVMFESSISEDSVTFNLPVLTDFYKNILNNKIRLEVVVDDRIFIPWEGSIEFNQPLIVKSVVAESDENENSYSKIKLISEPIVENEIVEKKQIQEKVEEVYDDSDILSSFENLKQETTKIKSSTLSKLIFEEKEQKQKVITEKKEPKQKIITEESNQLLIVKKHLKKLKEQIIDVDKFPNTANLTYLKNASKLYHESYYIILYEQLFEKYIDMCLENSKKLTFNYSSKNKKSNPLYETTSIVDVFNLLDVYDNNMAKIYENLKENPDNKNLKLFFEKGLVGLDEFKRDVSSFLFQTFSG